jgi:hypothetical protein
MKIKLFAFLAMSLFLFGCENSVTKNSNTEQETVITESHDHQDKDENLVLDNGNKWKWMTT